MKNIILIVVFILLTSCATKSSSPVTKKVQLDLTMAMDSKLIECNSGIIQSCGLYLKYYSALHSPEQGIAIADERCSKNESFFCYLSGYLNYYSGHVEEAFQQQVKLCEAKNMYSCHFLGAIQSARDANKKNYASNNYIRKSCELGNSRACITDYFFMKDKDSNLKQYDKIITELKKSPSTYADEAFILTTYLKEKSRKRFNGSLKELCHLGNQNACFYSEFFSYPETERIKKYVSMYRMYCNKGSSMACSFKCDADKADGNIEAANISCSKACIKEDINSCTDLGKISHNSKNNNDAIFYFKLSCLLSDTDGCHMLSYVHETNEKKEDAINPLKVLCDVGNVYGCNRLAVLKGSNGNLKESTKYSLASCEFNNGTGCFSYGIYLHKEQKPEAEKYFLKGCDLENGNSCLGQCLVEAEKGNTEKSKEFLIKACSQSESAVCNEFHNKKPSELNLSNEKLKNLCHYNPDKPWWYWATAVGVGILAGKVIH